MPSFVKTFEFWNRKFHYYLGLYFLFFLWLFSLTGLMLNHQSWFRDLYARHETQYDPDIETPAGETQLSQTLDVMRQLNLKGEIDWPPTQPVGHIDFNVSRPNGAAQVRVDLNAKHAYVKEFTNGTLHAFQIFHTFSGSRFNQPASSRDWARDQRLGARDGRAGRRPHRHGRGKLLHVVEAQKAQDARAGDPGPRHVSLCGLCRGCSLT